MTQSQYLPSLRLSATYPAESGGPETIEVTWETGAGLPDVHGIAKVIAALRGQSTASQARVVIDSSGAEEAISHLLKAKPDPATGGIFEDPVQFLVNEEPEPVVYRAEGPFPGPEVKGLRYHSNSSGVVFKRAGDAWTWAVSGDPERRTYQTEELLAGGWMVEVPE